MLDFAQTLRTLPRAAAIEVIYLVGHELSPSLPSPLDSGSVSPALDAAAGVEARGVARQIISQLEDARGKPIGSWAPEEQSEILIRLHQYLRTLTSHGPGVVRRAKSALKEFEALAL